MTDIVTPPTIAPLPPPPQPSDTPAEFDAKAFASLAAQVAMTQQTNASAAATQQNATAAHERATAASASAVTATQQADAAMGYRNQASQAAADAGQAATTAASAASSASASAVAAGKLNLGNKSSPPATDNEGQPLLAGATYYDTRPAPNGGWMVWTGTGWTRGISDIAGVSSVNAKTGAVTLSAADVGAASAANPTMTGAIAASGSVRGNKLDLGAGTSIDCSASNYFAKTISVNTTLTVNNVPAAPMRYGMVLEITLTGGVITWPAGTVWASGAAPAMSTGKVHLVFLATVNGGATWRASALPNYSA